MKINGNEIKPGNIIEYNGRLCVAVKTEHVKPGKGGAFNQVELKDIKAGTKFHERFRSDEAVERVYLEEREFQYLYPEGDGYVFMDKETYDQITLPAENLGDQVRYLQDSMDVSISFYNETPISVALPERVILEVVEAEPVIKGQTAASSFKPAILSNGVKIMVPPYIEMGEKIVVNTSENTFVERAKG